MVLRTPTFLKFLKQLLFSISYICFGGFFWQSKNPKEENLILLIVIGLIGLV